MATTGELNTIIAELGLVDIGDAASYLGEEFDKEEEALYRGQIPFMYTNMVIDSPKDEKVS